MKLNPFRGGRSHYINFDRAGKKNCKRLPLAGSHAFLEGAGK